MKLIQAQAEGAIRLSIAASVPVRHQLVIFPHAGGSSEFYRAWRDHLPADIDLVIMQYPHPSASGVAVNWNEPHAAIQRCMRGLASLLGIAPITLFGHSMGAFLAVHIAASLESRFRVAQLILSSQMAPASLQATLQTKQDIDHLTEQAIGLGEVPELSRSTSTVQTVVASAIHQDLALLQKLVRLPIGQLPVTRIFGGDSDPLIDREKLFEWLESLPKNTALELFPGGHFYFIDQVPLVVETILGSSRSVWPSHSSNPNA